MLSIACLIALCAGLPAAEPAWSKADDSRLVLQDVNVIDPASDNPLRPHQTVIIEGGRIKAIEPFRDGEIHGGRVLNLSSQYLLPGFVEMHAHVLLSPRDPNDGKVLPAPAAETTDAFLRALLAYGITTVRDPGAPTEAAIQLRNSLRDGRRIGPRIFTAGRALNGSAPGPEFATVSTPAEICAEVESQKNAGVDFIKVYSGLKPDQVRFAVECAHRAGLKVIGHIQRTTWNEAAELGIDVITHGLPWAVDYLPPSKREAPASMFGRVYWLQNVDYKSAQISRLVAMLASRKIPIDPTLITYHTKFWGNDPRYLVAPELAVVPKEYRDGWAKGSFTSDWAAQQYAEAQQQWRKLVAFVALMRSQGVLLTVGTDTPTPWTIPGVSFHQEMALLSETGASNHEVLRMATWNGAVALGRENEIGKIAPGYRADLVVLEANPLEKLANTQFVRLVLRDGIVHRPSDLLIAGNDSEEQDEKH